jgi:hypothetical protein
VRFESVARRFAAVCVALASVLGVLVCLPSCSSDPSPEAAPDFCGVAASSNTKCKEPTDCDLQLATDCTSLPKALSAATVAAAKDCLESGICGVGSCVSRGQTGAAPTDAHKKLAESFCKFCAPNLTDCTASFYKRGAKSAGLIVLPYAEEIATAVEEGCTGEPGCQAKFTTCASSVIARTVGELVDAPTADCIVKGFSKDDAEIPRGPDGKPQVATCTPANCPGCCREDRCEKGDTSGACGASAKACEICSATSKCTAGICKEPCGPDTCNGCCDGDTCVTTETNAKCGEKGAACVACATDLICSNHTCIDGSCQATCTNGCCSATGCQAGNTAAACGTGGEGCVVCGVGRACSNAACILDRTSLWDVYISFAFVPEKDKAGAAWDVLAGAPDPYVVVFSSEGASAHSGQTTVLTDTTDPFWKETPLKGVKASELLANTSIEFWDSDYDYDDYMGGCQLPLVPAMFDGSLLSHVCPATASTGAIDVTYRINPHVP